MKLTRLPRPKHATLTNIQHLNDPIPSYRIHINNYINNNFTYRGVPLTFEDFSNLTNIPIHIINSHLLSDESSIINLSNQEMVNSAAGVLISRAISLSLEANSISGKRIKALIAHEGNRYVPFVTTAVTQALTQYATGAATLASLAEKLRSVKVEQLPTNQTVNYITIEDATKIIRQEESKALQASGGSNRLLPGPAQSTSDQLQELWEEHDLANVPEVMAKALDSDGLRARNVTINGSDPYLTDKIEESLGL